MVVLAEVQVSHLLEVVAVSLGAGVAMTVTFSLVVLGSGRSDSARRGGRTTAATAYAVLAVLALVIFLAGVVLGVNVMLSK
jgi:hypothetical protein